jgi:hypothetical protein
LNPKPNLEVPPNPANVFERSELPKFCPGASAERAAKDELVRTPELPVMVLAKEPRILESVRDAGTTFRAAGAFSQTSLP